MSDDNLDENIARFNKKHYFCRKITAMIYNYSHRHPPTYSSEVENFQKRLNFIRTKLGGKWEHLQTDGLYGRGSRDAVKQFQEFAKQFQGFDNVVINGQLDDATQSAVNKFYKHALHNTLPPRRTAPPPLTSKYAQSRYLPSQPLYSGPPPRRSHNQPVVDTSSVVDSELKSFGKDILDLTAEVAEFMVDRNIRNAEDARKFIEQQLRAREDFLGNLIRRKENTFNAIIRRGFNNAIFYEGATYSQMMGDSVINPTKAGSSSRAATFEGWAKRHKDTLDKTRKRFVEMAMNDMKKAAENADINVKDNAFLKNADETIGKASESAGKWGKVATGAKCASWFINIGTSVWYVGHMVAADSEAEFNEYAGKLKDSLGTTAVDVGLALGGNVATRIAAGAIGGPAGIVVAALFTIVDVVSLCATKESISTHIWNFIKSIDWDGVMGFIRPCFAGMDQYPT